MRKAAFFSNQPSSVEAVYGRGRKAKLERLVELYPVVIGSGTFEQHAGKLKDMEVIFSTWGMPALGDAELARLPVLQAVFYAAGSVKGFARPLLERGVLVVSAWGANAAPVAEFTLAQILLSCKGYFRNTRECRSPELRHGGKIFRGKGVFGETIGLIGIGMIGGKVCELLKHFAVRVIVHDPYLSEKRARELGVEQVRLEEIFRQSYVVSNHLPNIQATQGMLHGKLFAQMRPDATFINTGRGAQVDEPALIAVLEARPDLTALLDVTFPEPPGKDSKLYRLPNVQLSSHIAGSLNDEVVRMADFAIEEFLRWEKGEPLEYRVTLEMLETMA